MNSRVAGIAAALMLLLAAAPAQATAPPLRGAATHPLLASSSRADSQRELDALEAAGATAVRVDLIWSSLEAAGKGTRDAGIVTRMDNLVADAEARGLEVLVTLWGTPCWASSAPEEPEEICAGTYWGSPRWVDRYPPTDPQDFADIAEYVADRWGDDIAALEIWNEPNLDIFLRTPTPAPVYAAMLKAAYPAVKAEAPGLTVLAPGMLNSDTTFLEALYAEGFQGYFDGISLHPFPQQYAPGQSNPPGQKFSYAAGVPAVRQKMVDHGDAAKKMWITEVGWTSCKPNGVSTWCVTHEQQAQNVGEALRIARDRWDFVEGLFVYTLRNAGTDPDSREAQMGLLYRDFSEKPAYGAFALALADLAADPFTKPPPVVPPPPSSPAPEQQQQVEVVASPPPDLAAPALSALRVTPAAVKSGRRFSFVWTLDEPATVTVSLERLARTRCGFSRKLCSRWVRAGTLLTREAAAGKGSAKLASSLRGKKLKAGRYRVAASAADAAGNRSKPARAAFRVR